MERFALDSCWSVQFDARAAVSARRSLLCIFDFLLGCWIVRWVGWIVRLVGCWVVCWVAQFDVCQHMAGFICKPGNLFYSRFCVVFFSCRPADMRNHRPAGRPLLGQHLVGLCNKLVGPACHHHRHANHANRCLFACLLACQVCHAGFFPASPARCACLASAWADTPCSCPVAACTPG